MSAQIRLPIDRACGRLFGTALLLLLLSAAPALALDPDAKFRDYAVDNWSVDDGLPQVSVLSITQDPIGYIWIGTQNGLARFDGLRFQIFDRRNSDGANPTNVHASLRDRRGRLWFATPAGLTLYENQRFRTVAIDPPTKPVYAVAENADGEIWIATPNGAMRLAGEKMIPVDGAGTPAYSLIRSGEDLWVGGLGTVSRHSAEGSRSYTIPAAGTVQVTRLAVVDGNVWIGTANGLFLLIKGAETPVAQPLDLQAKGQASEALRVENLHVDRNANLWISTPSTVYRRRPNGEVEVIDNRDFVSNAYVVSAFEDREGNLWLGSRTEGLFRLWDGWAKQLGQREGLTDPLIWSLARDGQGRLVLGSNSNVMRLTDSGIEEMVSTRQIPNLAAYEMSYDNRDRLWIGTRSGMAVIDQGKVATPAVFERLSRYQVSVIVPLPDGGAWIGSHDGLFRYDGTNLRKIPSAPDAPEAPIRAIHIAANGTLTVGTEAGVRRLDGDQLRIPDWARPLESFYVTSIVSIKPGLLGMTTRDSGIVLVSDDKVVVLDDRKGLPTNSSWIMQVLDDYLYVSTIDGVWRTPIAALPDPANAAPGAIPTEKVLGRRTGMQHIHCCNGGARARVLVDGSALWFPAIHGAVRIDTKSIKPPTVAPTVVVEGLHHGNRWYMPDQPIEIDSPRRDVELQFTALTFREPRSVHFRYRLEGYDHDWYDVGTRRSAFYTNLRPGHYRFRVEARTGDANAQFGTGGTTDRAQLEFHLVPRWFERRSVQGLGIALLVVLAAAAPLIIRNRYRRRGQYLESQVAARTHELVEANLRQSQANQALHDSNTQLATQIDERLAAERTLQHRNQELQTLNNQLESTQNQLIQSEKMASVGQLAAGVAHEINNPIGYVHSNLNSLERYVRDILELLDVYRNLEDADTDRRAAVAAQIAAHRKRIELEFLREDIGNLLSESLHGISRVEKIVRDLKEFSHVGEAEWQQADIHEGIESTLNVVAHEIKYKARLVKEYASIPKIECLPFQLNQVFLNLLVNAAQAIEDQGEIRIRTEADDNEVRVIISDSGKGISEAHLHRIFEPFFTTKPVGKGTGLGLSVSYGIIQKHGGNIEVFSEVGKGTTFVVHLPIRAAAGK
ncbi:MAG TPA: ATP-binding protein [Tahibacter sp.]|uniref:ATP-binding protein n=1 Tax=Tahibacter sp. TaxID=2056211 RepID=UPI002B60CC28|nr:ATP-binding protein [Tahibacter sp.]HSX62018.1 ATP-binding protein [Tahibacter sp.]